jgi:hypothetical protein
MKHFFITTSQNHTFFGILLAHNHSTDDDMNNSNEQAIAFIMLDDSPNIDQAATVSFFDCLLCPILVYPNYRIELVS